MIWYPYPHTRKHKRYQEEAFIKLFVKERLSNFHISRMQEAPDSILDNQNGLIIGCEVGMFASESEMKQLGNRRLTIDGDNRLSSKEVAKDIQKIIDDKVKKSFIHQPEGSKKYLLIYINKPLVSYKQIKEILQNKMLQKRDIDRIFLFCERELGVINKDVFLEVL